MKVKVTVKLKLKLVCDFCISTSKVNPELGSRAFFFQGGGGYMSSDCIKRLHTSACCRANVLNFSPPLRFNTRVKASF